MQTRCPLASCTSIAPAALTAGAGSRAGRDDCGSSRITRTGTRRAPLFTGPGVSSCPARYCARHLVSMLVCAPCPRATSLTVAPVRSTSCTIRIFSATGHSRRVRFPAGPICRSPPSALILVICATPLRSDYDGLIIPLARGGDPGATATRLLTTWAVAPPADSGAHLCGVSSRASWCRLLQTIAETHALTVQRLYPGRRVAQAGLSRRIGAGQTMGDARSSLD